MVVSNDESSSGSAAAGKPASAAVSEIAVVETTPADAPSRIGC